MLKATSTRDMNRAAVSVRNFLEGQGITIIQAQALNLVARAMGFPNSMAAAASIPRQSGLRAPVRLSTYADLQAALSKLSPQQLQMSLTVSEGCDENGNAEFIPAYELLPAGHESLQAASDGVLEDDQPVLLFNGPFEDDETLPRWDVTEALETVRIKAQFEMALGQNPAVVSQYVETFGALGAIDRLNADFELQMALGDYVLYSETEQGYWSNNFGWTTSPMAATGYPKDVPDGTTYDPLKDGTFVLFAHARDIKLD